MILSSLADTDRYIALHPLFARAFAYLRGTDLSALAPGRHAVQGEDIFAIVEHCAGRARTVAKLESHRRYIDIQLVLEGVDEMGWRPLAECENPIGEFDAARDIRFYDDAPASWVATPAGSFCIFFPDDAHAPLVGDGMIRKVVMKIAV
jgi:uncharacterized protein, YhcH/YjgK/YiaL family